MSIEINGDAHCSKAVTPLMNVTMMMINDFCCNHYHNHQVGEWILTRSTNANLELVVVMFIIPLIVNVSERHHLPSAVVIITSRISSYSDHDI